MLHKHALDHPHLPGTSMETIDRDPRLRMCTELPLEHRAAASQCRILSVACVCAFRQLMDEPLCVSVHPSQIREPILVAHVCCSPQPLVNVPVCARLFDWRERTCTKEPPVMRLAPSYLLCKSVPPSLGEADCRSNTWNIVHCANLR